MPLWWFIPIPVVMALIAHGAAARTLAVLGIILVGIALLERVLTLRTSEVSTMTLDLESRVIHCTRPRVDIPFSDIDGVVRIEQTSGLDLCTVRLRAIGARHGGEHSYILLTKGPAVAYFSGSGLPVEVVLNPPVPVS